MKKIFCIALALILTFALCACGAKSPDKMVYAVEAGSAGEAVAQEKGWEINSVESQAAALMEVEAGTSDAAVIDLLMAGAMIGEGTNYPNLKFTDSLTSEQYGVGCRKGSDLAAFINVVFNECWESGKLLEIAELYGVQETLIEMPAAEFTESADGDVAYIKEKGVLIVGITDFAPMDYKNEANEWVGFDADMARIVAEKLGVEIEFVEIDWNSKILELDAKSIDVVWNGMTLTEAVLNAMECSNPYCENAQVVVVPAK